MTPNLSSAQALARQRAGHAAENAEDYVELISELQREIGAAHKKDIAERLGVSHVTVHKTIKRLCNLGLVHAESYRAVCLTAAGAAMAREAHERHELVLRFLAHVGVPREAAEIDAEGIEHHVGPQTLDCMLRFCHAMEAEGVFSKPGVR
ncbi:manganese-binding transcriptional regulator MntR [Candidatus Poribacteria bacterium]|nr:manganese-binding transcriptional regulator MntR [Candidatus Poribacteria bacterium]